jgi:Fe-S-cluster containining protein
MGDAKRRREEIARLKSMSPQGGAAARRQAEEDEAALGKGIDPAAAVSDPSQLIAMTRRLRSHFETAKEKQNLDEAMRYLYQKVDATIHELRNIPIACGQGCSHCCTLWVTISAPEAIHVAKLVTAMGAEAMDRVRAAHEATKEFTSHARSRHPRDCAMLRDNSCTIYENRPRSCRGAASTDANICARAYRDLTNEVVPTPKLYMGSGVVYVTALYAALSNLALPNGHYEFNAAVTRVFDTPDAEQRWLAGENIFAGVLEEDGIPPVFYSQMNRVRHMAFDN